MPRLPAMEAICLWLPALSTQLWDLTAITAPSRLDIRFALRLPYVRNELRRSPGSVRYVVQSAWPGCFPSIGPVLLEIVIVHARRPRKPPLGTRLIVSAEVNS